MPRKKGMPQNRNRLYTHRAAFVGAAVLCAVCFDRLKSDGHTNKMNNKPYNTIPMMKIKVNLRKSLGYEGHNLDKLHKALGIIERAVNSEVFKNKILYYEFHYRKKLFGGYIDTPYTSTQVLEIIENAVEYPGNVERHSIDLYLELLTSSSGSVIGYGYPGEKEIYTYKDRFERMTSKEIANHIVHEWLHKLGFTHAHYNLPFGKRDQSVPYAVGRFIEELAHRV
jgi:hypothetical protein